MSRPGKALVYMFPLLVGSTILLLGHTALTQQTKLPAADSASAPVSPARPAPSTDEPRRISTPARRVPAVPPFVESRREAPAPAPAEPQVRRRAASATSAPAKRKVRTVTVEMLVTGYCPCRKCCGSFSDGKTASGKRINYNGGKFVAADTSLLPFGTRVSIPGYNGGRPVPVEDRGGRIKGRRLDVFFYSHHQARQWGARRIEVTVYLDEDD